MKLLEYLEDLLLTFEECVSSCSIKPFREYLKCRREKDYWKRRDVYETKADNF
jgi:hypothetical protein